MAEPIHGPDEREERGMSYSDSLLSTGERIELRERQHWFILVWAGRWAVSGSFAFAYSGWAVSDMAAGMSWDL